MAPRYSIIREMLLDSTLPRGPRIEPSELAKEAANNALDIIKENPESFIPAEGSTAQAAALILRADPADSNGLALLLLTDFFALPANEEKIKSSARQPSHTKEMVKKLAERQTGYSRKAPTGRNIDIVK